MPITSTSGIGPQNIINKTDSSIKSLNDVFKRLSSGMKTRQSPEGSAFIAMADQFTSQIKGVNQARIQVNDGVSVAQVADSGLQDVEAGLQRLHELSLQSANGTMNATDRKAIQEEAGSIQDHIQAIINDTHFNGVQLLASDQSLSFQTGANAGEQAQIKLKDFNGAFAQVDLSTQQGAENALATVQDAMQRVGSQRAEFGSAEARFVTAADTLATLSEALSAGSDRISNADFARQSSDRLSLSIRAQADVALQAQANFSGARVHQLLQ